MNLGSNLEQTIQLCFIKFSPKHTTEAPEAPHHIPLWGPVPRVGGTGQKTLKNLLPSTTTSMPIENKNTNKPIWPFILWIIFLYCTKNRKLSTKFFKWAIPGLFLFIFCSLEIIYRIKMYRVLNSDRRSRRRAHLLLDHCGTSSKFSQDQAFFKKMGQSRPLFVYFCSFLVTISIQIEKSVDGVLGIRTWAAGW